MSLLALNIMTLKKKARHGSTLTALVVVPHDLFRHRHPLDENECDLLIGKRLIAIERVILIAGFEEHGIVELLDFYKLRKFIQLTQECHPTLVRAFYNNIKNVDQDKY